MVVGKKLLEKRLEGKVDLGLILELRFLVSKHVSI